MNDLEEILSHKFITDRIICAEKLGYQVRTLEADCEVGESFTIGRDELTYIKIGKSFGKFNFAICINSKK